VITEGFVEVEGDTGVIQGCVDTTGRKFFQSSGEQLEVENDGLDVSVVLSERTADGWLVTERRGSEGATLTC
jgi:hypothetical protein